jgi:hypothetical protein
LKANPKDRIWAAGGYNWFGHFNELQLEQILLALMKNYIDEMRHPIENANKYSHRAFSEMIAETVTEYKCSPNPRLLSTSIYRLI